MSLALEEIFLNLMQNFPCLRVSYHLNSPFTFLVNLYKLTLFDFTYLYYIYKQLKDSL